MPVAFQDDITFLTQICGSQFFVPYVRLQMCRTVFCQSVTFFPLSSSSRHFLNVLSTIPSLSGTLGSIRSKAANIFSASSIRSSFSRFFSMSVAVQNIAKDV